VYELSETSWRATLLPVDCPEVAVAGIDPEVLGPSSGTTGWGCLACSFPPLMKNDDVIYYLKTRNYLTG
jgi:hypothetical protein